jgi:hypothetical protein
MNGNKTWEYNYGIQRPLYSVAALRSNAIKDPLYHNISFAVCILRLQNGLFLDGMSTRLATLFHYLVYPRANGF